MAQLAQLLFPSGGGNVRGLGRRALLDLTDLLQLPSRALATTRGMEITDPSAYLLRPEYERAKEAYPEKVAAFEAKHGPESAPQPGEALDQYAQRLQIPFAEAATRLSGEDVPKQPSEFMHQLASDPLNVLPGIIGQYKGATVLRKVPRKMGPMTPADWDRLYAKMKPYAGEHASKEIGPMAEEAFEESRRLQAPEVKFEGDERPYATKAEQVAMAENEIAGLEKELAKIKARPSIAPEDRSFGGKLYVINSLEDQIKRLRADADIIRGEGRQSSLYPPYGGEGKLGAAEFSPFEAAAASDDVSSLTPYTTISQHTKAIEQLEGEASKLKGQKYLTPDEENRLAEYDSMIAYHRDQLKQLNQVVRGERAVEGEAEDPILEKMETFRRQRILRDLRKPYKKGSSASRRISEEMGAASEAEALTPFSKASQHTKEVERIEGEIRQLRGDRNRQYLTPEEEKRLDHLQNLLSYHSDEAKRLGRRARER